MFTNSRPMVLGLAVVGATLAIAAALIFAMPPEKASGQEILEDAQDANSSVQTYKFAIDFWQTPQVEGDPPRFETSTEAVVVFNRGMHVIISGNDDSYGESLLLHGTQYKREAPDGAWEEYPSNFDSSRMVTLDSTKHFQIVNGLTDSTVVGEETLDGVQVRKITGRFDLQQRAQARIHRRRASG